MSETAVPSPVNPRADAVRPRFRWPMRIFLFVIVFDMVFHSLAVLLPYKDWCKELDIDLFPKRLPTNEEMRKLADKAGPDDSDPVSERIMESLGSVWSFLKPWPDAGTRKKITTWGQSGQFALCWLTTRLGFFEQLVRFEQRWTMFSPSVGKWEKLVRGWLLYADGSTRVVRISADPEDLTHYSHWFKEKVLQYETKLDGDWEARLGWCNLMAHRYPTKAKGTPLVKIYLVKVRYEYPEPGDDAMEVMRAQNGPPGWEKKAPFWEYDVKTRKGKYFKGKWPAPNLGATLTPKVPASK